MTDDIEHLAEQLADIVPPTVNLDGDLSVTIQLGTETVTIPEPFVGVIASSLYGLMLARCNVFDGAEDDRREFLRALDDRVVFDMGDWTRILRQHPSITS